MRKFSLACSIVLLLPSMAVAAPWVRGYVVTNYEPAWYYGGNPSFQKAGALNPGSDCPKGSHANLDYATFFKTPWRNVAAVEAINTHADPHIRQYMQLWAMTYRGFRDGVDVYINPFSAPDPGMQEVTGRIAEGFDLDGNSKTGGFTSPDGEKGIDNAYYRAFGCISSFRGPSYTAALSIRANSQMVQGLYTMVIRVSGNKDPLNDDDATVEIGYSPDHMVEGPNNIFLSDYSFRMVKDQEYSKVKATVKNGVVEILPVAELHTPNFSWYANQYGDADFHQGRLRLLPAANGDISGLIGGYRDWRNLFSEDNFTALGANTEMREHQDSVGLYYAFKRVADGLPDPKTGQKLGVSTAYRFKAVPAFVIDPAGPIPGAGVSATGPRTGHNRKLFLAHRDAFYKAIATHQVQPVPAGSEEGGAGVIEQLPDGSWKLLDQTDETASPKQPDKERGEKATIASTATVNAR